MRFLVMAFSIVGATSSYALDNKPIPAGQCVTASKGCGVSKTKAQCAQLACRLGGCKGEKKYGSGDCKTMSDEYDLAMCGSFKSTKKCKTAKPIFAAHGLRQNNPNQVVRPVVPSKPVKPSAHQGGNIAPKQ